MKKKLIALLLSFVLISAAYMPIAASDTRVSSSAAITEFMYGRYPNHYFLVKHSDDKKYIGFLVMNKRGVGHSVEVYNTYTHQMVFDSKDLIMDNDNNNNNNRNYVRNAKTIVDFDFKRDVVILSYKAFLQDKVAYDLYTGEVVPRYSSIIHF